MSLQLSIGFWSTFCLVGLSVALYLLLGTHRGRGYSNRRLPPSPPSDPIIGHARRIPLNYSWETYAEWSKSLGDIYYVQVFGRLIFILNSVEATRFLLDVRGSSTSDRPHSLVMNDLIGLGSTMPFLPYADHWRRQRRIMQQYFSPQAITMFKPIQEQEVRLYLKALLHSPLEFRSHITRLTSTISLKAAYGDSVYSLTQDDLHQMFVRTADGISRVSDAGGTIIDLIPALRYVPDWFPTWFPGVSVKRHAFQLREMIRKIMTIPIQELKSRRAKGIIDECFISSVLDDYGGAQAEDAELEEDVKTIGVLTFSAAYETTSSIVHSFFLTMVLNPDVMKKAQAEIDAYTGVKRIPTLDDRPELPYIDCIVKEVYRFHPSAPISLPHATTQDETYGEWTIPKGSIILGNIWAMMKDEKNFPDPLKFLPERHMINDGVDRKREGDAELETNVNPSEFIFGFGRRICPGRYFADANIWLTIANVLAVFDIKPYVDPESNEEVPPEISFTSGFTSTPKPFKCAIIPRSEKHVLLINE